MQKRRSPHRSLLHLERLEDRTVPAAPVNSFPGTQTVIEENALVFSAANGNGLSFTDADGPGPYQVELVVQTNPDTDGGCRRVVAHEPPPFLLCTAIYSKR